MAELRKDYPREIPIIEESMKNVKKIGADQLDLKCKLDALIKYHKTCAKAMDKLIEDINKCSLP
jgi:hypothetical protein